MESSGKTLQSYTRQHLQVLKTLEQTGVYRVQKSHIEEKNGAISQYYLELYDWYVRHAERPVPRPEGAEYPIWLFLEEENKLPPLSGSVCLELEIPRDLVVLTDVERWGYRVNYLYIPMDEKDRDAREAELKRNGIGNETALIQTGKGNFYPLLKRKIIQSWDRVFEDPATGSGLCQGTVMGVETGVAERSGLWSVKAAFFCIPVRRMPWRQLCKKTALYKSKRHM